MAASRPGPTRRVCGVWCARRCCGTRPGPGVSCDVTWTCLTRRATPNCGPRVVSSRAAHTNFEDRATADDRHAPAKGGSYEVRPPTRPRDTPADTGSGVVSPDPTRPPPRLTPHTTRCV